MIDETPNNHEIRRRKGCGVRLYGLGRYEPPAIETATAIHSEESLGVKKSDTLRILHFEGDPK